MQSEYLHLLMSDMVLTEEADKILRRFLKKYIALYIS